MQSADPRQPQFLRFPRERFESWLEQQFEVTAYGSHAAASATLVAILDGEDGQFVALFRGGNLPVGLCGVVHRKGARFSAYLEAASGPSLRFAKLRNERRNQNAGYGTHV
ncbi:MAG: hypothetical protein ABIT36_00820 [Steroidobacteraceae bacterium]